MQNEEVRVGRCQIPKCWRPSHSRRTATWLIRKSSGSESDRIRLNPAFSFFYFFGNRIFNQGGGLNFRNRTAGHNLRRKEGDWIPNPAAKCFAGLAFALAKRAERHLSYGFGTALQAPGEVENKGFLKVLKASKGKISNLFLFFGNERTRNGGLRRHGEEESPGKLPHLIP